MRYVLRCADLVLRSLHPLDVPRRSRAGRRGVTQFPVMAVAFGSSLGCGMVVCRARIFWPSREFRLRVRDGVSKEDPVKRPASIGILSAAFGLAIAATASVSFTMTANGQAPAIGQAPPPAIGQAPAIGQVSAVGQAASSSAASSAAPAAPQPGDKPVSFSLDQATRGQVTFARVCVDCHGDDLRGGLNGGPPLRGNAFDEVFANGAPVSGLFTFISTAMPPDSPGQFSADVYAELTAYILQQNGYQAGAPLPTDTDAQDHLLVQK